MPPPAVEPVREAAAVRPTNRQLGAAEYMARRAERAGVPTVVTLQVTDRCNYDCVHCYETHGQKPELSLAEIDRILGEIAAAGTMFVTLTGGEFFTRRDADDILRAARRHGFAVKLLTTGHYIDARRADLIRDLGAIQVDMSFYSADPHVHEHVTQTPGSWQRTLNAARLLVERGVIVLLKSPVMSVNARSLADIARLAQSLGAQFAFDPKVTAREDGDLGPTGLRVDDDTLRAFYGDGETGVWRDLCASYTGGDGSHDKPLDTTPCRAGTVTASVNPQGQVWACNVLPVPCGDLRESSFQDIWAHSPMLDKIRALTWGRIEICNRCELRAFCSRCHAMALLEDGDMSGPSSEACRHAVILRDLLRERGLVSSAHTAMPPTQPSPSRGVRPAALRVWGQGARTS